MRFSEEAEQKKLFDWAAYQPKLRWMFAIPNGGNRNPREAARLKAGGVKAGVSDIFLPMPTVAPCGLSDSGAGFAGLFIEMKRRKVDGYSAVSQNQVEFQDRMRWEGYKCVVCYGADEAIDEITEYLKFC